MGKGAAVNPRSDQSTVRSGQRSDVATGDFQRVTSAGSFELRGYDPGRHLSCNKHFDSFKIDFSNFIIWLFDFQIFWCNRFCFNSAIRQSYPPSPISDLVVRNINYDKKYATLEWTATGDQLDVGKGLKSVLKLFQNILEQAIDLFRVPLAEVSEYFTSFYDLKTVWNVILLKIAFDNVRFKVVVKHCLFNLPVYELNHKMFGYVT